MGEIRIELDHAGLEQVLCSSGVRDEVDRIVKQIAKAAGEGMKSSTYIGKPDKHGGKRAKGQVWTGTYAARKAEAEDRALLRALDAGRS
jgi:hypothetical protein